MLRFQKYFKCKQLTLIQIININRNNQDQYILINIDKQMKYSFFIFNIRRSVYENYGILPFKHIAKYFYLIPIINDLNSNIQERAGKINLAIKNHLHSRKINGKVNLVAYSASGIDTRYALSCLGLGDFCCSLSTISSPHLGSKASQMYDRKVFKEIVFDPIARVMGIGLKPFTELVPQNMQSFNKVAENVPHIRYFSVGGEKLPNQMNEGFRQVGSFLRTKVIKNYVYQNDGIMGHDEIKWGRHLVNFEEDHMDIVGLTGNKSKQNVFNLLQQAVNQSKKIQKPQ